MTMDADIALHVIIEGLNQKEKADIYQAWLHSPIRYEKTFDEYLSSLKPYRKSTDNEKEEILKKWGDK